MTNGIALLRRHQRRSPSFLPQPIAPLLRKLLLESTYIPVVYPQGNFIIRNDRSKLLRTAKQRWTRPGVSAQGLMKPAARLLAVSLLTAALCVVGIRSSGTMDPCDDN